MPVVDTAVTRRLVLDLVVPYTQLTGAGELGHVFDEKRRGEELTVCLAHLPDVDDLPHRVGLIVEVGNPDGLGNAGAVLPGNDPVQLVA